MDDYIKVVIEIKCGDDYVRDERHVYGKAATGAQLMDAVGEAINAVRHHYYTAGDDMSMLINAACGETDQCISQDGLTLHAEGSMGYPEASFEAAWELVLRAMERKEDE